MSRLIFISILSREQFEIILTHYVFIYFSSQQDEEEKKRERKIDKDEVNVLKNSRVYKKEKDIEQQTNNQTRSVCMKKK
jgi:hypothetical protein